MCSVESCESVHTGWPPQQGTQPALAPLIVLGSVSPMATPEQMRPALAPLLSILRDADGREDAWCSYFQVRLCAATKPASPMALGHEHDLLGVGGIVFCAQCGPLRTCLH